MGLIYLAAILIPNGSCWMELNPIIPITQLAFRSKRVPRSPQNIASEPGGGEPLALAVTRPGQSYTRLFHAQVRAADLV